ncbi:Ger(x)C family spore germination protein [Gracilibacillus sp. YIM 98692]|uniref:Ger(x)C family spore germination protein n=1 Tax=Gracilibacillus sp. YIM 98692 TaxID=2663532 RepID=UPI0013D08DF2|nr:Ger(x)C family spore germination protein [Gracilibacillus sp. YIM 98692]
MNKRIIFILCNIIFLLAGCWDEQPIEEHGFAIGSSIDLAEEKNEGTYNVMFTSQFVVTSGFGTPAQGSGGGKKSFMNLSVTGESIFESSREMSTKTSLTPFYEHLKVIVVSSDIAKEPNLFSSLMDIFLRDHEMRRGIRVAVTEGEAKSLLEINPENEKLPAMYINEVLKKNAKSIEVMDPVTMGVLQQYLLTKSSYVLPMLLSEENEINSEGGAVFHGQENKMIGTLSNDEMKGLNFIKGKVNGGIVNLEVDGQSVIYEIKNARSQIKIDTQNPNNMNISVSIKAEGSIGEKFGSQSLKDPKYQAKLEKNVGKAIEQLAMKSLEKGQNELNADIYGFDSILKQKHYDVWKEVKDKWITGDQLFTKTNVQISAEAIVRSIGSSDVTHEKGVE